MLKTFPSTPADARIARRRSVTWRWGSSVPSEKIDTWSGRLPRLWKKLEMVESRTEHVVGDGTSVQKRIGLAGLEGDQRGRGMELVVDGPSV